MRIITSTIIYEDSAGEVGQQHNVVYVKDDSPFNSENMRQVFIDSLLKEEEVSVHKHQTSEFSSMVYVFLTFFMFVVLQLATFTFLFLYNVLVTHVPTDVFINGALISLIVGAVIDRVIVHLTRPERLYA